MFKIDTYDTYLSMETVSIFNTFETLLLNLTRLIVAPPTLLRHQCTKQKSSDCVFLLLTYSYDIMIV